MALKNFIKDGFYARIERIDYSKQACFIKGIVQVYEDETLSKKIFNTTFDISGNHNALEITREITDEVALFDEAPEFLNIKKCDKVLINIKNPKTDFAKQNNGYVIIREGDKIKFFSPTFIKKENKYFEKSEKTYKEIYEIKTVQQFEEKINSSNPISSLYEHIKTIEDYKDCVDV